MSPAPDWVTLGHDGFVARFGTERRQRTGCCGIWVLAVFWTGMLAAACGTGHLGLDLGTVCLLSMMPFLWLLSWGMALTAFDRHELRLGPHELVWHRRRWGLPRHVAIPLAGLEVGSATYLAGKGYSTAHLHLTEPSGTRHVLELPSGQFHREYDRVVRDTAWIEATVQAAAQRAGPPEPPAPDAGLEALRQR